MIIAVCHQKGGTGKTTLSTSLACEFESRGQSVLLIDADPQGSSNTWRIAAESDEGLPTVLALPNDSMHRKGQLDRASSGYTHTVIDCPPALGKITRSALMAAQVVMIPSPPNATDIWALNDTLELIADAQQFNEQLRPFIVVMRRQGNSKGADAGERALRAQAEEVGCPVLNTVIHSRVAWSNAMLNGSFVGEYEPGGKAAKELKKVVDELLDEVSQ